MTRAIDPFEDYLRRKKVEMLEEQYRGTDKQAQESQDETLQDDWTPPADADNAEREVQVEQEMNEFFSEGGTAGADLFERANVIDEDRVEEIQDALNDVFEAEKREPEAASGVDDTFVDFFKQVQSDFEPDSTVSREIVQPPESHDEPGDFEDEPLTAEFPVPGEESATEADVAADAEAEAEEQGPDLPAFLEVSPRLDGADQIGAEHSSSELGAPEFGTTEFGDAEQQVAVATENRLELSKILAAPKEGEDLRQHVHLLSRLVVKLVERSSMPESEIIEVLIKSGAEF